MRGAWRFISAVAAAVALWGSGGAAFGGGAFGGGALAGSGVGTVLRDGVDGAGAAGGAVGGEAERVGGREALPLGRAAAASANGSRGVGGGADGAGGDDSWWIVRTVGALAVVIGLIFGLKWLMGKAAGSAGTVRGQLGAGGRAPSGVLFVLGRYPVARGQTLVLVRVDRRVLLLGQSSEGFRTLSEVTDAEEVAGLVSKCAAADGSGIGGAFTRELTRAQRSARTGDDGSVIVEGKRRRRSKGRIAGGVEGAGPAGVSLSGVIERISGGQRA